jgi:O-antigen/teichoic acid export membrane protein
VVLLILVDGNGRWVVVLPAASLAAVNLLTSVVASRVTGFSWRTLFGKLVRRRTFQGRRIRSIAGPRLILSLTIPLALASDRVVLSHFASAQDVAVYGVCLQLFAPVTALVAAAAQPLWPIYVAARATGETGPRVTRLVLGFCLGTLLVSGTLLVLSGPLAKIVGDGKVDLGLLVPVAGALMTLVFAAAYPVGMALTTPKELRFMAAANVIALPLNVAGSIVLARSLGAAGPMLASTGMGVGLTLAGAYYLRTRHHPSRLQPLSVGLSEQSEHDAGPRVGSCCSTKAATSGEWICVLCAATLSSGQSHHRIRSSASRVGSSKRKPRWRMGFPPTISYGSTDRRTTVRAPMAAPSPIVTPDMISAS